MVEYNSGAQGLDHELSLYLKTPKLLIDGTTRCAVDVMDPGGELDTGLRAQIYSVQIIFES